jgi:hypothetical protein
MLAFKRCLAVALLAVPGVLVGCGSSGSSTTTPAAYVKSICSAIGPFERDVQSRSSALNLTSIKNPSQGKTALHDFLTAAATDTDHAVSQLKAAGTPKVNNGKAISTGIVNAFAQLKGALAQAASKASSLPTASSQAFKSAADTLGTSVRSSMSSISSSLGTLKSPELEQAAAKDPTCKSLATG